MPRKPASVSPELTAVSRRAAKRLDKRERIRRAAFELFSSKGYAATSTREVAERAGVATGTLFLYASDKPDLLCLVMHDRLRDAAQRELSAVPRRGPLVDRLMAVFGGLVATYAEHPDLGRELVAVFPSARGPNGVQLRVMTVGFLAQLAALVAEHQRRGDVARDIDADLAAQNLFALYFAALLSWMSALVSVEQALAGLRRSLQLFVRGLGP